jgi:WD40 repeat protein
MGHRFPTAPQFGAHFRRVGNATLVVMLLSACNELLGIGEPIDGPHVAGTSGGQGGDDGGGQSGDDGGGQSGNADDGGESGSGAGGGTHGGEEGRTPGQSGGAGTGGDSGHAGDSGAQGGTGEGASGAGGHGGRPGDGADPVVITSGTPVTARLNIDFELQLQASGGDGNPCTFEFGDQGLPNTLGVVLERDGRLHGVPTTTGRFEFDIVATDGTSSDTKRFTLNVTRSRWLVYESDEDEAGTHYLYAVDVATEPPTKVRLPHRVPRTNVVKYPLFSFSPDGRYLAYLADSDSSPQEPLFPRLFVVDMTGEQPGTPVRVSGMYSDPGRVLEAAWSPDSRGLAFAVLNVASPTELEVYYAALSNLATTREVGGADGDDQWEALGWVGSDVLMFSTFRALASTRPFVNIQGQPFEQLFYGRTQQVWHELETALVMTRAENECMDGTWNLVDFREGSPVPRTFVRGYVIGSPGLEYVAYREPDTLRYEIYRPWDTAEIASFDSGFMGNRYCSPGAWSPDARTFVAGGDDDRLVIAALSENVGTHRVLAGDYPGVGENEPPRFSPNGEWLAFSTVGGPYVVKNVGDGGEHLMRVDPASMPAPRFNVPQIRFSPDSKWIAYADPGVSGRPPRAFIADLTTGEPVGTAVDLGAVDGGGIHRIEWAPHSTELALGGSSRGPWDIHLVRITPDGPVTTQLNAPMSCETTQSCQLVTTFVFQP